MKPQHFRGAFREDDLARAVYSEGAGIGRVIPSAVAVPADVEDVQALVRWACENPAALIPRGSGSGMAGGAVGPGIIVDLSRMRELAPLDTATGTLWAGAGVVCSEVGSSALKHGSRFPVDPSSSRFCTIGGMAATNAAGAHSLKFGSMREWVVALECVFSDGTRGIIERGREWPECDPIRRLRENREKLRATWEAAGEDHRLLRKDSSGYAVGRFLSSGDLVDLLVGSEGTLAIITRVKVRLTPLPIATSSVVGAFGSLTDAARGAAAARDEGASACELLDKTFIHFASRSASASEDLKRWAIQSTAAVLLAEIEADDVASAQAGAERLRAAFVKCGAESAGVAETAGSEREIWELRHAVSPILSQMKNLVSMQFIEDSAVPPAALPEYVRGVREALQGRGVEGVIFGHAGDSHVHVNPLLNLSDEGWRATLSGLLNDVVDLTARLGGTLTGEHGDGRLRTPLISRLWSEPALNAFAQVKHCFDPDGILNPGVKIPLAGQVPIGDVKYDPSLAPLPRAARAALDDVVARRAYDDFRLSLIA